MEKLHYHLIAGLVMCHPKDKPEDAGGIPINAILTTKDGRITAAALGQGQQALQVQMHNKIADTEMVVQDVHIDSISHLGEMTPEEFLPKVSDGLKAGMAAAAAQKH